MAIGILIWLCLYFFFGMMTLSTKNSELTAIEEEDKRRFRLIMHISAIIQLLILFAGLGTALGFAIYYIVGAV